MLALQGWAARRRRQFWRRVHQGVGWLRRLLDRLARRAARGHEAARMDAMTTTPLGQARFKACQRCEHLKGPAPIEQCGLCHCLMRAKTQLPKARCPAGKW